MRNILSIVSLMLVGFTSAYAVGTAAGTDITNSATLNYDVGSVAQTPVTSNTDTFKVDNKIDLLVSHVDSAAVSVTNGSTAQVLTFTVTNEGNQVQDFLLTSNQDGTNPFGLTDTFDTTSVLIFVDGNANGTYDAGTDTATFIDELAADANITVFIVSDIPIAQVANDVSAHTLIAQVAVGGTASTQGAAIATDDSGSADVAGTVQNVFADGAGANGASDAALNGKHADNDAYIVVTASLAVTKDSCVISDPINGTTNPKRIPGAVIRYNIQIANTGTAAASSVLVTDAIAAEFGTSAANLAVHTAACPAVANPCAARAGTVEAVGGTTGAGTASVTLDYAGIAAGATECGYIEITIQ